MNRAVRQLLAAASMALGGCAGMQPAYEEPAVLANNSPQSREELSRLIGQALHQPPVLLADDAFLHEDILIVGRRLRRDQNGLLLNGREIAAPERFRLVKRGADCFVIREGAEGRWHLMQACTALAAR